MTIATPLYELTRYQRELEILADSGEVPAEQILETLNALEGDIQEKAVQVAAFTMNLDATAQAVKAAGKAMLERAQRIERRAEAIREYLHFNLELSGVSKIESPQFVLAIRKNPPQVVIDAEDQIPAEFIVTPPPPDPRPDKKAIAAAIKAGEDVPGCHLLQTTRLEIKP